MVIIIHNGSFYIYIYIYKSGTTEKRIYKKNIENIKIQIKN